MPSVHEAQHAYLVTELRSLPYDDDTTAGIGVASKDAYQEFEEVRTKTVGVFASLEDVAVHFARMYGHDVLVRAPGAAPERVRLSVAHIRRLLDAADLDAKPFVVTTEDGLEDGDQSFAITRLALNVVSPHYYLKAHANELVPRADL